MYNIIKKMRWNTLTMMSVMRILCLCVWHTNVKEKEMVSLRKVSFWGRFSLINCALWRNKANSLKSFKGVSALCIKLALCTNWKHFGSNKYEFDANKDRLEHQLCFYYLFDFRQFTHPILYILSNPDHLH